MTESAFVKGRRYLAEGRLTVRAIDDAAGTVSAECHGDGELYHLSRDPLGRWSCDCPARGRCAHLIALGLVVAFRRAS